MRGRNLIYPEDNSDLVNLFDEDYEEKNFSSIPSEAPFDWSRNRILGGPHPITSHMTSSKAKEAQQTYQSKRKAFTDKKRHNLIHELSAVDLSSLPVETCFD
jgi:hypothetical protein